MTRILTLITILAAFSGLSQETRAQDPSLMVVGAKLWSDNCMRCHNARSSMERNDQDWKTIITHMRVRANLSKSDANAIVAYIQMTNMPEPTLSSHGVTSKLLASARLRDTEKDTPGVDAERSDGGRNESQPD